MKPWLSAILILCFFFAGRATHVVGGNFEIRQVDRNVFEIDLIIFEDMKGKADLPDIMYAAAYHKGSWNLEKILTLNLTSRNPITVGDKCFKPEQLQFEEVRYTITTTLPDDASGYYLSTEYCCRNALISNMVVDDEKTGITFTAEIADPGLTGGNTSPKLGTYPKLGYFCVGDIRNVDLSAVDNEGDSLVYNLVIPLDADLNFSPPPYDLMEYLPGFSYQNTLGADPPLSINTTTGLLTGLAPMVNVYLFSYSVSEYRDGKKIGEVRRDIQFYSLPCMPEKPPYFVGQPDTLLHLTDFEEICPNLIARDSNNLDTMSISYTLTGQIADRENLSLPKNKGFGEVRANLCWTPACADAFLKSDFTVTATVRSACDTAQYISRNYHFKMEPIHAQLSQFASNVLTPNGDGINDYFRIRALEAAPCIENYDLHIFNRWGQEVYVGSDASRGWDGLINGQKAAEGVYYYTLRGIYRDQSFEYKSFLTLFN